MATKKLTNEEKLYSKKIKKPPYLIYNILGGVWKLLFKRKYGLTYTFNYDFRKEKGACIFISNHSSRMDYIFTGLPLLPNNFNFVAGYNEFYRSHLKGVFSLLQVVPKKNFTPDFYAIKEISRIIKAGGKVVLFPEGMNSIAGMNQPVAIGTGKLIKHFGVPVYYSVIKGGYMTAPKYKQDEHLGKVEVIFDRMFTPEEISTLSDTEIEDIINQKLYHDDIKWNKERQIHYSNMDTIADGLENLLYICPKCGKEFTLKGSGNAFNCSNCGYGVTIDDTYQMHATAGNDLIFDTQTAWFNWQREVVKQQIKDGLGKFTCKVKLGTLPDYKPLKNLDTSLITGEGIVTIDENGFTFDGVNEGQPFKFNLSPKEVPTYGMCTDISRFYTFYKGKFYEFYPETPCVEKVFLLTEEIHRASGGKWQDFKFDK